jgi:hypothetical protein
MERLKNERCCGTEVRVIPQRNSANGSSETLFDLPGLKDYASTPLYHDEQILQTLDTML